MLHHRTVHQQHTSVGPPNKRCKVFRPSGNHHVDYFGTNVVHWASLLRSPAGLMHCTFVFTGGGGPLVQLCFATNPLPLTSLLRTRFHSPGNQQACCAAAGDAGLGGWQAGQHIQKLRQPHSQQRLPASAAAAAPGTTSNPEFPPYQVLQKGNAYDLRFYQVYPVVEMDYQRREEGYLALGSYQDGANSSSSKFGHTQPVVMCYHPNVSMWARIWGCGTGPARLCVLVLDTTRLQWQVAICNTCCLLIFSVI